MPAKKPAKKAKRKAIAPPKELWMVIFDGGEGWMLGSNASEIACFATKELATAAAEEISDGCTFTVVRVIPRKRAKGAKR